jgi:predicted nucleotidyltransferase
MHKERIVYISLSRLISLDGDMHDPGFAICIRHQRIFDIIKKYVEKLLDNPNLRKITKISDYIQKSEPRQFHPLVERILSAIEELAYTNINIKHVGIFGSVAKSFSRNLNCIEKWKPESDLDLIIVIDERTEERSMKKLIDDHFSSQSNNNGMEIEWSKDRERFYYFRRGFHIDIQLHVRNDDYYTRITPLLGHSIFWSNYHVLYSERNLPVESYLKIPKIPLMRPERIKLYIDDDLGLDAFIRRCKKVDINIDPRRVMAINVSNFVWALTGMRPVTLKDGIDFIEDQIDYITNNIANVPNGLMLDDLAQIEEIISKDIQGPSDIQENCLKRSGSILERIKISLRGFR